MASRLSAGENTNAPGPMSRRETDSNTSIFTRIFADLIKGDGKQSQEEARSSDFDAQVMATDLKWREGRRNCKTNSHKVSE